MTNGRSGNGGGEASGGDDSTSRRDEPAVAPRAGHAGAGAPELDVSGPRGADAEGLDGRPTVPAGPASGPRRTDPTDGGAPEQDASGPRGADAGSLDGRPIAPARPATGLRRTHHTDDERVLVWAPTGRDAAASCELLEQEGFTCVVCPSAAAFCREVAAGAGAAIVADEALTLASAARLSHVLSQQPAWSDLPLIVFTGRDTPIEAVLDRLVPTANITVLERPPRAPTLRSVVRAALRARRRQYETRDLLERLADADRRKDEFLAMLGHELRNPLAAIRNATVLLGHGQVDPRTMRLRGVIERQSHNLTRMVEDLLDVTRVSSGKFVLRRERVEVSSLVSRVTQACEPRARENLQDLRIDLPTAPAMVHGDPVRLEQVFSNLLHNAIKYTPDGGHIQVAVRVEGDRVVVRVVDDGIGIDAAMLPRIFDLFTQVPVTLDRAQGGLGLGLPLVRRLVALHGGEVVAASPGLDRGAAFEVRLPLATNEGLGAELAPVSDAAGADAERARRLVVVEDNPDIRECMAELLGAWGYEVAQAADGSQGLELILADPPRVAIVDVGLPKLDGYDLARRVRASLGPRRVRLIAMTGYGQPQDRERALEAGFDEHLVKPVSPDALARVISTGSADAGPLAVAG